MMTKLVRVVSTRERAFCGTIAVLRLRDCEEGPQWYSLLRLNHQVVLVEVAWRDWLRMTYWTKRSYCSCQRGGIKGTSCWIIIILDQLLRRRWSSEWTTNNRNKSGGRKDKIDDRDGIVWYMVHILIPNTIYFHRSIHTSTYARSQVHRMKYNIIVSDQDPS